MITINVDAMRDEAQAVLATLHPVDRRQIAELAEGVQQVVWLQLDAQYRGILTTELAGAIAAACEHITTRILADDCAAVVAEQAEGQTA